MLIRVSPASSLAVDLDDLKQRIRVDTDGDDATLEKLIRSETERYENYIGRVMALTGFEWRQCSWTERICIPVTPGREVTEVAYFDADDVEQILDASDWTFEVTDESVRVRMMSTFARPELSTRSHPVVVRFSAGYDAPGVSGSGDDPAFAPSENDQRNIMLLVRRIYDTDEAMPDSDFRRSFGNRRIYR